MTELPKNVRKYSESPLFDETSVPAALLRDHKTKAGAWGRIVVEAGALIYTRQGNPAQRVEAGETALILPQEPHRVAPDGEVRFKVEFFRKEEPAK